MSEGDLPRDQSPRCLRSAASQSHRGSRPRSGYDEGVLPRRTLGITVGITTVILVHKRCGMYVRSIHICRMNLSRVGKAVIVH
jgi:hypothetical protein